MRDITDMDRMVLKPGDVLVLRPRERLRAEEMERLTQRAERMHRQHSLRVIVVDYCCDMAVLTPPKGK